jgi:hypothetical protein
MTTAERIISALSNRRGFDGWWDDMGEDIQQEVIAEIEGIVVGESVLVIQSDDEILAELKTSNRWGRNEQPERDVAYEFLVDIDLPIRRIRMDADDTLHIYTAAPFSTEQAVQLGRRLDPDEFSDEGEYYRLWWD